MNDIELLDLIKKGEIENILLQKDLTARLNSLAAKGLVDINGGQIFITPKGEEVKKFLHKPALKSPKIQKDMEEFSSTTLKRNSLYVYLCLMLLCAAAVFLSIIIIQGQ